jgi:hypothetical protein
MRQIEIGDLVIFPDGEEFYVNSYLDIDGDETDKAEFAEAILVHSFDDKWAAISLFDIERVPRKEN